MHAKAAGEAAMLAKESYEKVLRAARIAAEASGKAVLAEIKREAGCKLHATSHWLLANLPGYKPRWPVCGSRC